MPDNKNVPTLNETVCSPEFGADGCVLPPEDSYDEESEK